MFFFLDKREGFDIFIIDLKSFTHTFLLTHSEESLDLSKFETNKLKTNALDFTY